MHLSVIIPAYNEEQRLGRTLESVRSYLARQPYEYEIIVVNDGSTDGTGQVVRRSQADSKRIRLIEYSPNRGKGFAVRTGMGEATGEYRLFMDADGSTPIEEIEKFWPRFKEGNSVVIGSRRVPGSVIRTEQPGYRLFLGWALRKAVQAIVGTRIVDSQNGFKAFTAAAADAIFPEQTVSGWAFDIEILVLARARGFAIAEVPIVWTDDRKSKVTARGMLSMLAEVVRIGRSVQRDNLERLGRFAMVGFIGYMLSAVLLALLPRAISIEAISWALATEAAIINNFMFHNVWTFRDRRINGTVSCFKKFLQFNLTSAGALIIQTTLGTAAVAIFGPEYRQAILPIVIVATVAPYNWFMYRRYIWRKK